MRRPEPRKPRGIFDVINGPWLGRGSWVQGTGNIIC